MILVNNKGNFSYEAEGVVLIPGTNKVDEEAFERFVAHPLMTALDEQGEFICEKIGKSNAKDLIAMIKDTFDLETLEGMKENESRSSVLKAIGEQISKLKQGEQE